MKIFLLILFCYIIPTLIGLIVIGMINFPLIKSAKDFFIPSRVAFSDRMINFDYIYFPLWNIFLLVEIILIMIFSALQAMIAAILNNTNVQQEIRKILHF